MAEIVDQVEEHNRDWALDAGKYAFDCYVLTGAYDGSRLNLHFKMRLMDPSGRYQTGSELRPLNGAQEEGQFVTTLAFLGEPDPATRAGNAALGHPREARHAAHGAVDVRHRAPAVGRGRRRSPLEEQSPQVAVRVAPKVEA